MLRVVLVAVLLGSASAARAASVQSLNPITRVVQLLQDLQKKTEADQDVEDKLFVKYRCWAKSNIEAKKSSNADAEERIGVLTTYIDNIDSGKITFTSEKDDLTKQLKSINDDIQNSENMRTKEADDFEDAEEEMTASITAMENAIKVLGDATKGSLGLIRTAESSSTQRAAEAASLDKAISIGEQVLSKGDALFLQRLLGAHRVTPHDGDHKKLNRKATFKNKYKARSTNIQTILKDTLEEFKTNLADARSAEDKAKSNYQKLMTSKKAEKTETETALNDMSTENGAKAQSKEESVEEKTALETQKENDEKFITQIEEALKLKREEYDARKSLRAGELKAFTEAINILYSDDARDLAAKSFKSQGYFLMQVDQQKRLSVAQLLHKLAAKTADTRIHKLARHVRVAAPDASVFDKIVDALDQMMVDLQAEHDKDLQDKETCENDRAEATQEARKLAISIDEDTDKIRALTEEIGDLNSQINKNNNTIQKLEQELAEATQQRKDEQDEFRRSSEDDQAVYKLVQKAMGVLTKFYEDNDLDLLQKQPAKAGEAPPPPPATFGDGPYGGKTQEKNGIIATMEIVADDIKQDAQKAKQDEKEAQEEFDQFKDETRTSVGELTDEITAMQSQIGDKEQEVSTLTTERRTKFGSMTAEKQGILAAYKDGCAWLLNSFEARKKKREEEVEGLTAAKTMLTSGTNA